MSQGGRARILRVAIVATFLAAALGAPTASPARASHGGLVVTAATRYEVQPEAARVHVTIDAVATSHEPDPADGRLYFSGTTFAVPADAANVAAFSDGAPLQVRIVEETSDFRAVEVTFATRVFFRESYRYQVTFDLVDAGGRADRSVRVGTSLAAFPVWAFGTDEEAGSSVVVELPAGYEPTVQGSAMSVDQGQQQTQLSAQPDDPFGFFAYVSADRPGAFAEDVVEVPLGDDSARVTIRAWEDDPAWGRRTANLLRDGLPVLEDLIGVDYPHAGTLFVEEAAISRLGEYAGIFDPNAALISVRYDADAFVTLHEAAHLWFNSRLLDGRWIGEAWAEFYSIEAGEQLGEDGFRWELTGQLRRSRIPLNDWGAVGREDLAVEDYAYAASYVVAGRIADRTNLDALREVWQAAAARELAYVLPDGSPDPGRARLGQPGWQRLLDLLEERTGERFDDVWAEWIVNEEQQQLLAQRASVRSAYRDVVEQADEWVLPPTIRLDLGDWEFDRARDDLEQAEDILHDRDVIATLSSALELTASDRLRTAFEGDGGLDAASTLANVEIDALTDLAAATERLGEEPSLVEQIGLIGTNPGVALAAARDDYEAGQLGDARRGAAAAIEARDAADDAGESRVLLAAGGVLGLDGLVLAGLSAWRLAGDRRLARLRRRAGVAPR